MMEDYMARLEENQELPPIRSLYGFEFREFDERRLPDPGDKKWHIKQLWQRSHEIINLALQGLKNTEIAEMLNIHPQTVSSTLNSELGMQKLSELRAKRDADTIDVAKKVAELSEKALKVYEEIFDHPQCELKLKMEAANTVLMDLGGHRAPTKIDSRTLHTHATMSQIEEFKQRGLIAAKESGLLALLPNKSEDNAKLNDSIECSYDEVEFTGAGGGI